MKSLTQTLAANEAQLNDELALEDVLERALAAQGHDKLTLERLIARARRIAYVNGIVSIYGLLEETVDSDT